jgi:hypothetical protein
VTVAHWTVEVIFALLARNEAYSEERDEKNRARTPRETPRRGGIRSIRRLKNCQEAREDDASSAGRSSFRGVSRRDPEFHSLGPESTATLF